MSNFRSFDKVNLELRPFNVVIGANASGKSNLTQAFAFLRDLSTYGLDDAVSIQGGSEFLRNLRLTDTPSSSFGVELDFRRAMYLGEDKVRRTVYFASDSAHYDFSVHYRKKGVGYFVDQEKLALSGNFRSTGARPRYRAEGSITYSRGPDGKVGVEFNPKGEFEFEQSKVARYALSYRESMRLKPTELLTAGHLPIGPLFLNDIAVYDFDPKLPKRAAPITGKVSLEEDGNNLALALRHIAQDPRGRKKLTALIRSLLPFVTKVSVDRLVDKSLLFKVRESYGTERYVPASVVSDGTINLVALVVALFFETRPVAVIEEPERNIHPHLIARLMELVKDASKRRQIILTTHNPELVKHASLEDLLLVTRGGDGISAVSRPSDSSQIREFLTREIGIEELFAGGALEGVSQS